MDLIENDTHRANDLFTETHKSFRKHYGLLEEFFEHILTYSYCTKYNEINICHSCDQKHVSYRKWCT